MTEYSDTLIGVSPDLIESLLDDANRLSALIGPIANDGIKDLLADVSGGLASILSFAPSVEVVS